ncbi:MAG: flagellar basal body rod protein FlgC [Firmicutes bacterium]|nr:flagellar basal body rod protein FlgC [Bacillota bacterium]
MKMFQAIKTAASGLSAERLRLDLIASNIANIRTTRTEGGELYRRKTAVFAAVLAKNAAGQGVRVAAINEQQTAPRWEYDPTHPDANEEGYVAYPNINLLQEMTDMVTATRAYEANVTVLNAGKSIFLKALEIGRG